jgi:hypothetical protein
MKVSQMTEKMISRRVSKGANESESRATLTELINLVSNQNLAYALNYQGFATYSFGEKFAQAVAA